MRFVKAATLDRLVDALVTDDGELESTFVNVFLGEFQFFKLPCHLCLNLSVFLLPQPHIEPSRRRRRF